MKRRFPFVVLFIAAFGAVAAKPAGAMVLYGTAGGNDVYA